MGSILVTGATSDIGSQICKTLENSGHSILMTDLSEEDLQETVNKTIYNVVSFIYFIDSKITFI